MAFWKKHHIVSLSLALLVTGSSFLSAALALLTSIVLARHLTPSSFGEFSASLSTVLLILPFAGFGIAQTWMKAFRENYDGTRYEAASYKILLASVSLGLVGVAIWSVSGQKSTEMRYVLLMLSTILIGHTLWELMLARQQIHGKHASVAFLLLFQNILRFLIVAITISLPWMQPSITAAAAAYATASILMALVAGSILCGGVTPFTKVGPPASRTEAQILDVLRRSFPFALAAGFQLIYYQSDIVMLEALADAESAGQYNVAFLLIGATYILPNSIFQRFLQPKIYQWATEDPMRIHHTFIFGTVVLAMVGILAGVFVWLVAEPLIIAVFGSDYEPAIAFVQLLVFASPFTFAAYCMGSILLTHDGFKAKAALMGIVALFNIIANYLVIPTLGATGASLTTVASTVLRCTLYLIFVRRLLKQQTTSFWDV